MAPRPRTAPAAVADVRFAAFIAALLLYAARGTPTPDAMGAVEILTGLLLLVAAGPAAVADALRAAQPWGWMRGAQALMLYGLTVPVLAALANGNDAAFIARDIVAFLFMLLPLFFYGLVQRGTARAVVMTMAAVTMGLAFSWRVLMPAVLSEYGLEGILQRVQPADPAYLANAPTVLFAALLLIGLGGLRVYAAPRPRNFAMAAVLVVLGALPFVTMALILQRASIGLGLAGLALLVAWAFTARPYRALPLVIAAALVLALTAPWLAELAGDLARKTANVGLNMRWQEAQAAIAALGGDPAAVLFGRGWGAAFASPAVGGGTVNFTHNLLTTYGLKTGLCGMALAVLYLGALARLLLPLLRGRAVLAVALAVPLAIDAMLYASFKSLDFGVILLVLAVWGGRAVSLHPRRVYSMSGSPPA